MRILVAPSLQWTLADCVLWSQNSLAIKKVVLLVQLHSDGVVEVDLRISKCDIWSSIWCAIEGGGDAQRLTFINIGWILARLYHVKVSSSHEPTRNKYRIWEKICEKFLRWWKMKWCIHWIQVVWAYIVALIHIDLKTDFPA